MKGLVPSMFVVLALSASGVEVAPGDSLAEVRAALGQPRGQLERGGWQRLIYDRGEVELVRGEVTRVALRSAEAHERYLAERQAAAEQARLAQEERTARRTAEGEALKARKLTDPLFQSAPVAYQVAFWEDFALRYPEVPSAEVLTIARLRLVESEAIERHRREESQRLADLEERVRQAEARAAAAELAAERAQRYPRYVGYGSRRGRDYDPMVFMPVEYRFGENPQPPYVTPSGNPAGRMDGAPYVTPSGNPALPAYYPPPRERFRGSGRSRF
jgi:hypothetical protein